MCYGFLSVMVHNERRENGQRGGRPLKGAAPQAAERNETR
jgi:hypothetical protein